MRMWAFKHKLTRR